MRIDDLVVAMVLDLLYSPYSPYDSATMGAFDVVTAVVAIWLRINLGNRSLPVIAVWSVAAILFGLTIARLVVGAGLAPRLADSQRDAALANPVYGNGLAQQITSTFDVVLCGLAWCGLVVAITAFDAEATRRGPKIYRGNDDSAADELIQGSSNGN